jgi:hypothetical protein
MLEKWVSNSSARFSKLPSPDLIDLGKRLSQEAGWAGMACRTRVVIPDDFQALLDQFQKGLPAHIGWGALCALL